MNVPANAAKPKSATEGGGNGDLYAKFGSQPPRQQRRATSPTGSYGVAAGRITYTYGADVTINGNATVESPITLPGRSGNAPTDTAVQVIIF